MRLDEFLHRHAMHWAEHQRPSWPLVIGLPETSRPTLTFLWKTISAHAWLQADRTRRLTLGTGDRAEAMRWMRERAETCVVLLARLTDEPDPFLEEPKGLFAGATVSAAGEEWLFIGMSALLLELACGRLAGAHPFHQDMREEMAWMAEGFRLERSYALSEAGRLASKASDGAAGLRQAAARFRVPAEQAWGDAYALEAKAALEGCLDKAAASAAADAIREVPELKGPFWPLIEPHIDRHAKLFKIGRIKKLAAHAAVKFLL